MVWDRLDGLGGHGKGRHGWDRTCRTARSPTCISHHTGGAQALSMRGWWRWHTLLGANRNTHTTHDTHGPPPCTTTCTTLSCSASSTTTKLLHNLSGWTTDKQYISSSADKPFDKLSTNNFWATNVYGCSTDGPTSPTSPARWG